MYIGQSLVSVNSSLLNMEKLNQKIDSLKFVKEVFSNISDQECKKTNKNIEKEKVLCKCEKIGGALLTVVSLVASAALLVLLVNPVAPLVAIGVMTGLSITITLFFTGLYLSNKDTGNKEMCTPEKFDKLISIGRNNAITTYSDYSDSYHSGAPQDRFTHFYRYDHKTVAEFIHTSTTLSDDKENKCVNGYLNNYLVNVKKDDNDGKFFYLKSIIKKISADIIEASTELEIKRIADKKNMIVNLHEGNFKVLPIEVTKMIGQLTVSTMKI